MTLYPIELCTLQLHPNLSPNSCWSVLGLVTAADALLTCLSCSRVSSYMRRGVGCRHSPPYDLMHAMHEILDVSSSSYKIYLPL